MSWFEGTSCGIQTQLLSYWCLFRLGISANI